MAIIYDKSRTPSSLMKDIEKARNVALKAKRAAEDVENSSKKSIRSEESTRHSLTFYFIIGFFMLLALSAAYVAFYNHLAVGWIIQLNKAGLIEQSNKIPFLELDKVLSIIISALGTSLGFIIGYYFKNKDK